MSTKGDLFSNLPVGKGAIKILEDRLAGKADPIETLATSPITPPTTSSAPSIEQEGTFLSTPLISAASIRAQKRRAGAERIRILRNPSEDDDFTILTKTLLGG